MDHQNLISGEVKTLTTRALMSLQLDPSIILVHLVELLQAHGRA